MKWRGKHDELEGINLLELAPFRTADWEEREDRVVVLRPVPARQGIRGAIDRLLHLMSARKLRLDELGSFAWRQLDGEHTVAQIAKQMSQAFGDKVQPAEERLGYLVRVLRREGLVGYPGWDDSAERRVPCRRVSVEP